MAGTSKKENITVVEADGGIFKLGVARADVAHIEVIDVDFMLFLKNGNRIVLANAAMDAMSAHPPLILFADGAKIPLDSLMDEVGNINIGDLSLPALSSFLPFEKAESVKEVKDSSSSSDQQSTESQDQSGQAKIEGLAPTNAEVVADAIKKMLMDGKPSDKTHPFPDPPNPNVVMFSSPSSPPASPGTPAPTPTEPIMKISIFNVVEHDQTGNIISGSGSDASLARNSNFSAQLAPENILGTAGADVIYSDAPQYMGSGFAKIFNIAVAGNVATINTLTVKNIPLAWTIVGATDLGNGTWSIPLNSLNATSGFDFKLMYQNFAADPLHPVHVGPVGVQFILEITDPAGASSTINQTIFLAVSDAASPLDMLYVDANGNTVYVLPAQGNPDNVLAGDGNDTVYASLGNDTVQGGAGDDYLDGGSDNDSLYGDDGNDTLIGGSGADYLDGGTGENWAYYNDATATTGVTVNLATGQGVGGFAQGDTYLNIQDVLGSAYGDVLIGDSNNNSLLGAGGNDTLVGGAGNNYLDGGTGIDTADYSAAAGSLTITLDVNGAANINNSQGGIDQLVNIENLIGGSADDLLTGNAGVNILQGGAGNDTLDGGGGSDTLDGGTGSNWASYQSSVTTGVNADLGTPTNNTGNAAGETYINIQNLLGSNLGDTLTGDAGDNIVSGAGGDDTLYGGAGNNTLEGGAGADALIGGGGVSDVNWASYQTSTSITGLVVDLGNAANNTGEASGDTYTNIDNLLGSSYDDTLFGNSSNNSIVGGNGNDTLDGGGGTDVLDGGAGIDKVSFASLTTPGAGVILANGGSTVIADIGGGNTATLINIEIFEGSNNADTMYGSNNGDTLTGLDGNDILVGGNGNDLLVGGNGDDTLDGGFGSDTLDGGAGIDSVSYASLGTNSVTLTMDAFDHTKFFMEASNLAGNGIDTDTLINIENFFSGSGNDNLHGGVGNETLAGGLGDDFLDGGIGNDLIYGDLASTADTTSPYDGADTIHGGDDNDTMYGGGGNDTIYGDAGDDTLYGGAGNNTLDGGTGADSLNGTGTPGDINWASYQSSTSGLTVDLGNAANNTGDAAGDTYTNIQNLLGSNQDDLLTGDGLDNIIDGAGGNDTLYGGMGNDTLIGGSGADYLDGQGGAANWASYQSSTSGLTVDLGNAANNTGDAAGDAFVNIQNLQGSIFDDTLSGDALANIIDGSAGNDTLYGRGGNDTLLGGAGNDVLDGGVGNDYIDGGAGISDKVSFLSSLAGVTITVSSIDPTLATAMDGTYTDTIINVEIIEGSNYNDIISGTDVNNTLLGGAGDDTLNGGLGNDTLDGGVGIDTVDFTLAGYGTSPVVVNVNGASSTAIVGGDTKTLIGIEQIVGGDGNDTISGDDSNNILFGAAGDDTLVGGLGNDSIHGGDGNDIIYGDLVSTANTTSSNDGADILYGDAGSDTIYGGGGDDTLDGGAGADKLYGGAGSNWLSYASSTAVTVNLGTGTVFGGDATGDVFNNIQNLIGGSGNDTLTGNGSINILMGGAGADTLAGGIGNDTLDGGNGIDTADYSSATAVLNITLDALGNAANVSDGLGGIDQLLGFENLIGGGMNDILTGNAQANILTGGLGNDTLNGGAGDDTLIGGAGADTLSGGTGNNWASYASSAAVVVNLQTGTGSGGEAGGDKLISIQNLIGGSGNDTLTGDGNINILMGGAGNDLINGGAGNDTLYGENGNDTLVGGQGNDVLYGGNAIAAAGNDTADYTSATGVLNIALDASGNAANVSDGLGGTDQLFGIVNLTGGANNDILSGNSNANTMTGGLGNDILYGMDGADILRGGAGNDILYGGSAWNAGTGTDVLYGEDGNDVLYAGASASTLDGGNGDDTLFGSLGSDTLLGGAGNDTLIGGAGNNQLNGGTGTDIADYSAQTGALNITLLGAANGNVTGAGIFDTLLGIENVIGGSGNDTITADINANSINGNGGTDTVSYAKSTLAVTIAINGSSNSAAGKGGFAAGDILVNIENLTGSNYNDWLGGDSNANSLSGGSGNDYLLDGDTTAAMADTLNGGIGLDAASYTAWAGGYGFTFYNPNSADWSKSSAEVRIDTLISIENLRGTNYADTFYGSSSYTDWSYGNDGNDVFYLDTSSTYQDLIFGGNGIDKASYAINPSTGLANFTGVTLNLITGANSGGASNDTFSIGAAADIEQWELSNGNDSFTAGNSGFSWTVWGNAGNDTLVGNIAGDALFGGAGNDTLIGGGGADILVGGASTTDAAGGSDWASYVSSAAAVTVDLTDANNDGLADTTGLGGDAEGDAYYYINNLMGSAYSDTLSGNAYDNTLTGGAGNDTLSGGFGNDTADYSSATGVLNIALDASGNAADVSDGLGGIDQLYGFENLIGGGNNDTFTGNANTNILTGGLGSDTLTGGAGDDTLVGGGGADILIGGTGTTDAAGGNDWASYVGSAAAVTVNLTDVNSDGQADANGLGGDAAGDVYYYLNNLLGSANSDILTGNANANTLIGGFGNDMLTGGLGNDTLIGGAGADTMVGGTNTTDAAGGSDWASYTGSAAAVTVNLTDANSDGRADANGLGGDAAGDAYYYINNLLGSANNDILTGNANDNTLIGGLGNDTLAGGLGADILIGGTSTTDAAGGSDWASYVSSAAAVMVDLTDVNSDGQADANGLGGDAAGDVYYYINNLLGSANSDILTGNVNANTLTGGLGNDTLTGGAGADTLIGGASTTDAAGGSDLASYVGSAAAVTVNLTDANNDGRADAVGLGGDAAGDVYYYINNLLGSANSDILTGNVKANTLTGGAGDDTLTGGAGADTLIGGTSTTDAAGGNDWASFVGSAAAVTVNLTDANSDGQADAPGLGGDAAGGAYYYINNLLGSANSDILTGNANANTLIGGFGNDMLTGGLGNDTLIGGAGADTMVGGTNTTDAAGGSDWASYTGSAAAVTVNLTDANSDGRADANGLGGDAAGDAYYYINNLLGSANNDILTGNANDNTLIGGLGNDTLAGGLGADILIGGASTTDAAGGSDWASYVSSAAAVTVDLTDANTDGHADFTGLGGDAAGDVYYYINNLLGSANSDILTGNANDNTLIGGGGADSLYGGAGADTLMVAAGDLTTTVADGGADASLDTLQITGIAAGTTLDLSSFDASVTSIEKLDIMDGVNSSLAFGLTDIQALVDNGDASSLTIRMDSGDTLIFNLAANETVSSAFDPTFGITHYTFSDSVSLATATLDLVTV